MEKNKALKKAKEEFDAISQDEHEKYLAELRMKHIMDTQAVEEYGYEKGIKEGENKKSIEIAKKMLEKGANIEFIQECTGLSKEEVEKLNQNLERFQKKASNYQNLLAFFEGYDIITKSEKMFDSGGRKCTHI